MSLTLYIGNLPSAATEDDLRSKFARFGTVESATVVKDEETGRSRRFGYVEMASATDARTAIDRLHMTQYEEVTISVSVARVE